MYSLKKSHSMRRRFLELLMYVDLRSCVLIFLVMLLLLWWILTVAAGPNSNYPAGL